MGKSGKKVDRHKKALHYLAGTNNSNNNNNNTNPSGSAYAAHAARALLRPKTAHDVVPLLQPKKKNTLSLHDEANEKDNKSVLFHSLVMKSLSYYRKRFLEHHNSDNNHNNNINSSDSRNIIPASMKPNTASMVEHLSHCPSPQDSVRESNIAVQRCVVAETAPLSNNNNNNNKSYSMSLLLLVMTAMESFVKSHPHLLEESNTDTNNNNGDVNSLAIGSVPLVLTDTDESAAYLKKELDALYHCTSKPSKNKKSNQKNTTVTTDNVFTPLSLEVQVLGSERFPAAPSLDRSCRHVPLLIVSLNNFLHIEKRSAVWKFVGSVLVFVDTTVVVKDTSKQVLKSVEWTCPFIETLKGLETTTTTANNNNNNTLEVLCEQRWGCVGHVNRFGVVVVSHALPDNTSKEENLALLKRKTAALEAFLTHPLWGYLLSRTPVKTRIDKSTASTTASKEESAEKPKSTVHYTVCDGAQRLLFLFSLLRGMCNRPLPNGPSTPSTPLTHPTSLVIHVNTKELVYYLYNVLSHVVRSAENELENPNSKGGMILFTNPTMAKRKSVMLLSDYEGESQYVSSVRTEEDKVRLCRKFDELVRENKPLYNNNNNNSSGKEGSLKENIVVLITCHGLLPREGHVFLQYDILADIFNFNTFLLEKVFHPSIEGEGEERTVRRTRTVTRKRSRSLSPTPTPTSTPKDTKSEDGASQTSSSASYGYVLLLLRPCEVQGALAILAPSPPLSSPIDYQPQSFPSIPFISFREELFHLHQTVFEVHRSGFEAYRSFMRVYCTVGPPTVYRYDYTKDPSYRIQPAKPYTNETKKDKKKGKMDTSTGDEEGRREEEGEAPPLSLQTVAEEFGYTTPPPLDLRLKETPYRPVEDYIGAVRRKGRKDRAELKAFADRFIGGEQPEDHNVE